MPVLIAIEKETLEILYSLLLLNGNTMLEFPNSIDWMVFGGVK